MKFTQKTKPVSNIALINSFPPWNRNLIAETIQIGHSDTVFPQSDILLFTFSEISVVCK